MNLASAGTSRLVIVASPVPLARWVRHNTGRPRPWKLYELRIDHQPVMQVEHCGHPTALRPYFMRGPLATAQKFRTLKQAQAEAVRLVEDATGLQILITKGNS